MNIQHLKYAFEVAKVGSISKAAQNLYMGQPNLSKAIKELEKTVNITIFKRSSKGVQITPKGQEFLRYAKTILLQYEEIEALGQRKVTEKQVLRLVIPRASYIAEAYTNFLLKLDLQEALHMDLWETNALSAIKKMKEGHFDIGIVRCHKDFHDYFIGLLEESDLAWRVMMELPYSLLLSRKHPLASRQKIDRKDLFECIEVIHGDTMLPHLPSNVSESERRNTPGNKKVYISERGSQFDLLSRIPGTYMWASPMPEDLLVRNGLVQRECEESGTFMDILVLQKVHEMSRAGCIFIQELERMIFDIKSGGEIRV